MKRWILKCYINKKDVRIGVGTYPEVSLADARQQALKLRSEIQAGRDPRIKRKIGPSTWGDLAQSWLEIKTDWSPGHRDDVVRNMNRYLLPVFDKTAASTITPMMVIEALKPVIEEKSETGHRALSICSQVFRYGVALGVVPSDPCRDLKGALPSRRTREHLAAITDPQKIGQLMRDINAYPHSPIVKAAMLLSAYTACRPQEIYCSTWEEIDMKHKVWTIPAERMKGRREQRVPLPSQAIMLLENLANFMMLKIRSGYVFRSMRSKSHISENTVLFALRSLGYGRGEMTAHGFRSMFSTSANNSGKWEPDLIEAQLAHAEKNEVRAAYNRTDFFERRIAMMQWYADYLDVLEKSIH